MGNYLFSNIEEPAVGSYTINSYGDCNLIIDHIEKNNSTFGAYTGLCPYDEDIIIHYKTIE